MRMSQWVAPAALACAGSANGAPLPDVRAIIMTVNGEYLSYSGDFGSRRVVDAQTRVDAAGNKFLFGVAQGTRKAEGRQSSAVRLSGTFVRDWTSSISTRTAVSFSQNRPVFVNREIAQDINLKVLDRTVLTGGARYARYFGDVESLSWSAGAAQYFRSGLVSYRFSSFDLKGLGKRNAHLATLKLNDRFGSSQVWVGRGSAIHEGDWLARPGRGTSSSVELSRSHKVAVGLEVGIALKRSSHRTETTKVHGTGARFGLTIRR